VVAGTFSWKRPEVKPAVSDSEKTEYAVVFTPANGNYTVVEFRIRLTVNKADVSLTPPVAKTDLVYTGSAQELVSAGSVKGGTLYYAVTTEQAAPADANAYATAIPRKTDTGTYYVWYMVKGDSNHNDTEAACVSSTIHGTISQTVTFKVVNGSWDDETTADKTVTLTGYEGDTLKLTADQIPAVGSKPKDNTCRAGSWDVTPSTETAITEATTYTYTYAAKEASVVTKASEAKTLTYTGSAQELVTAGTAEGGTMQYALGTATEATEPYTTSIPTATNVGT
jgi:hypothetical protein